MKMKNIKLVFVFTILILALLLIPNKCKATDTFFTTNGIKVIKEVKKNNKGNINLKISNITLSSNGNYGWAIGTTNLSSDISVWHILGDFNEQNKTATINLSVADGDVLSVLRKTNDIYLYIKDNINNTFIVDALQMDLTLPPYKAFELYVQSDNYYIIGGDILPVSFAQQWNGATYDIENAWYKFEKITDKNLIDKYNEALINEIEFDSIFDISINDIKSIENWNMCEKDNNYPNTKISKERLPSDSGVYYLYMKAKDTDSKMVYGYTIFGLDNESPTVNSIKVISPETGIYKTGQIVKIRVNFSEIIKGESIPILKIKFGDSAERILTDGTIKDNYIEYMYNIQDSDKGQLATVSLTGGTIKDSHNNSAKLYCHNNNRKYY